MKLGALARNWPLKITSLLLAVMLWVVATAEQPASRVLPVTLVPQGPAGRSLTGDPPAVTALVVGPRRELIKLTGAHLTLTRILPDTITGRAVTLDLLPSEVEVPRGGEVRVQDIQPRQVTIQLDPVVFRSVPVHADLRLELDSGTRLVRAVQVFPGVVRLTGPADQVARIDSVKTMPLRVEKVEGVFERSVAIDTEGFGTVKVSPPEVMINFEVLPDTAKREGQ
ncbi:MAG TPA: hypothetical protein VLK88_02385 [Gemmatimonadales bacterium]|nr:hypothetical protein [Gemmatimonadales bacterium]